MTFAINAKDWRLSCRRLRIDPKIARPWAVQLHHEVDAGRYWRSKADDGQELVDPSAIRWSDDFDAIDTLLILADEDGRPQAPIVAGTSAASEWVPCPLPPPADMVLAARQIAALLGHVDVEPPSSFVALAAAYGHEVRVSRAVPPGQMIWFDPAPILHPVVVDPGALPAVCINPADAERWNIEADEPQEAQPDAE